MSVDDARAWAPILTLVLLPTFAWIGRRMLKSIHALVNDRLDRALLRIDDLERIIRRSDEMTDPGSTAETLRHKVEP